MKSPPILEVDKEISKTNDAPETLKEDPSFPRFRPDEFHIENAGKQGFF